MTEQDWDAFADLAIRRHRVGPLVAEARHRVPMPERVQSALETHARENAMAALSHIHETRGLLDVMAETGATPTMLKGWPLSDRLYQNPCLRHIGDVDILVGKEHVVDCNQALLDRGYVPVGSSRRRARVIASQALRDECKDVTYGHPERRIMIELHWRLYTYPHWPEPISTPGATTSQDSQIGPIRCLSDRTNMLFLAIHGTQHIWARLKWLADIAELARLRGPDLLQRDLEEAGAVNAQIALGLALRLASRVFASPLPPSLVRPDPKLDRLEAWNLAMIARDDMAPAMPRYRFWVRFMVMRIMPSWSHILGMLRYDTVRRLRLIAADAAASLR